MLRSLLLPGLYIYAWVAFVSWNFGSAREARNNNGAVATSHFIDGHPDWIMRGNIYEVNVRQYTPEGTFKAFEKNLDRLKSMGAQTLWFMPINPISSVDRKGLLGSYYAVADYTRINPEFGNLQDWKELVAHAHKMGFKVIIDWVPNHTGADNHWLTDHPDFYVKDSTGKAAVPYDWTDTRKLDYRNMALQDTMIESMRYWINVSDIDGFRCDVAGDVPDEFWKKCISALKETKPGIFMLAEADKPSLHTDGFDATYAWGMFAMMKRVARGERTADALDSVRKQVEATFPPNALKMFFTSNHDENSWNKADYGTMPGAVHAPFAVFTQTMPRDIPLIYSGQEEPVLDSISFFYKDAIHFNHFARAKFYKTLLQLRKDNPALAANAAFRKVSLGNDKAIYAFTREAKGKKILVVLNLSASAQTARLSDATLTGKVYNLFERRNEQLSARRWSVQPWGYAVYVY